MLYQHQQTALNHTRKNPRSALWMGCGTGKTLVAITRIKELGKPTLIIAPKRVIDHTWPEELEKWWPECRWVSLSTTPKKRDAILKSKPADVTLINFELVAKVQESIDEWPWSSIVIDESSRVKSPSTKVFKALQRVAGYWESLIELTGTPAPNGLTDLWSQMYLLDAGRRLGKRVTHFRNRWFMHNPYTHEFKPLAHAQREIETLCKDICLSMPTEDYVDLPNKQVIDVSVDLPTPAARAYEKMRKDLVISLKDTDLTAATAAVMLNKLLQIASGSAYDDDQNVVQFHTAKLDALDDIVGGEPVMIVYQYRHELSAMRKRYPNLVELRDSQNTVERWNKGQIPILAIHPASAGHGLNLQHGGRVQVWTSPTWNLEHYQQTVARVYRNGQTKPVVIYRIVAENTADRNVYDRLNSKADVQNLLLDALKGFKQPTTQ